MSLPKPANPVLNPSSPYAQHLLLMLPLTEGTGQPGVILGADGVTAGAPSVTTWTASAGTWSTNSDGTCLHQTGTNPLRIGTDSTSGAWLPTGDCTICVIRGRSGSFPSTGFWASGITTVGNTKAFSLLIPRNSGATRWQYGSASPLEAALTAPYALDPPDILVVTAGAAGRSIYKNGVLKNSSATPVTRTSDTTSLLLMNAPETQDLNFFQIFGTQWDDATVAAWSADPYVALYAATAHRSGFGAQKPSRRQQGRRV